MMSVVGTCSTRKIRNKKIQDVHELQLDDRWWMPDQCTHNNPSRLTMAFHLKQQQKNEWQAVFIYKLLTWYACVLFQWIVVLLATRMVCRHTKVPHLLWKTSHVNVHSCEGLLERTLDSIELPAVRLEVILSGSERPFWSANILIKCMYSCLGECNARLNGAWGSYKTPLE